MMRSLWSHFSMDFCSSSMMFEGSASSGHVIFPLKYPHLWFTCIDSWKHMMKMAQLDPSSSRCRMFAGSCSMEGDDAGGSGAGVVAGTVEGAVAGTVEGAVAGVVDMVEQTGVG
jgi:hypothetical protein